MSDTHIKTAHAYGVQKALQSVGYSSTEEVIKEAQALGLIEAPKPASTFQALLKPTK